MNARRLRAVAVITTSLVVAGIAALIFLAPLLREARGGGPVAASPAPHLVTLPGETVKFTFLTPSKGWAAASIAADSVWIFGTSDSARSWHLLYSLLLPPAATLERLQFFDASHGLLVLNGIESVLAWKTSDGGRSWNLLALPERTFYVTFSDPDHGWLRTSPVPGPDTLYATNDGGTAWAPLPPPPADHADPVFRNQFEGWMEADGSPPRFYSSVDGGRSWQPHDLPPLPQCPPKAPECAPLAGAASWPHAGAGYAPAQVNILPGRGVVVYLDVAAFVTYDLGATWRSIANAPDGIGSYADICFQDSDHWWVIRSNTLYKTSDAGRTWKTVSDRVIFDHLLPNILDSSHAWAMQQAQDDAPPGARPNLVWELDLTSDGGVHWSQATVPVPG